MSNHPPFSLRFDDDRNHAVIAKPRDAQDDVRGLLRELLLLLGSPTH